MFCCVQKKRASQKLPAAAYSVKSADSFSGNSAASTVHSSGAASSAAGNLSAYDPLTNAIWTWSEAKVAYELSLLHLSCGPLNKPAGALEAVTGQQLLMEFQDPNSGMWPAGTSMGDRARVAIEIEKIVRCFLVDQAKAGSKAFVVPDRQRMANKACWTYTTGQVAEAASHAYLDSNGDEMEDSDGEAIQIILPDGGLTGRQVLTAQWRGLNNAEWRGKLMGIFAKRGILLQQQVADHEGYQVVEEFVPADGAPCLKEDAEHASAERGSVSSG